MASTGSGSMKTGEAGAGASSSISTGEAGAGASSSPCPCPTLSPHLSSLPQRLVLTVAGGRNFHDMAAAFAKLDSIHLDRSGSWPLHGAGKSGIARIVSGGSPGADTLAAQYAAQRGLPLTVFPADWQSHGRKAGMLRNSQMVAAATMVLAFWDGVSPGTADTIAKTIAAGKPLCIVRY
jgi:hypothetical protein